MTKGQIQEARFLIADRPHLIWHTKDYQNLSAETIVEAVLNYGNWIDFMHLKDIFGVQALEEIFKTLSSKKRTNLRPKTIHYFKNYFNRYA